MRISFGKVLLILGMVGGAVYGVTFLRGSRIVGFSEKRRQIQQLEHENEVLQRELEARRNHLTRLREDPEELKLEIERRLKLMSPGQKEFIIQDESTAEPGAGAHPAEPHQ
jgi:hypothetical protein